MSQAKLAKLVGVTQQSISKIECAQMSASDEVKIGVAYHLRTQVDSLFPMPVLYRHNDVHYDDHMAHCLPQRPVCPDCLQPVSRV